MMLSPRTAVRALHVEKERPPRRGSLPFKKRRFPRLALSSLNDDGNEDPLIYSRTDLKESESKVAATTPSAEKIAALALVAAAASGKNNTTADSFVMEAPKKHGFFSYEDQAVASTTTSSFEESENPDTGLDSTTGKKFHKPLLTSPLPNGCHGRTSRHNSYCRRQPYNGSKFCKTHYQAIIATGVATDEELKSGKIFHVGEVPDAGKDASSDGMTSTGIVLPSIHQQDKRYTGIATEIRCKATTTRGRACGYCAVENSKYCHLHATFDTNPPPRRGGSSSLANAVKEGSSSETKLVKSNSKTSQGGASGKADGAKRKRLSTTKNLKKHMEHAPYPLLSTLSTEQWLNRKVIVATGPLTNHVGLVEKWGNGWISVRLPGVGLHNRRSFELFLHPDPDSATSGSKLGADEVGTRIEVFDAVVDRSSATRNRAPETPRIDQKGLTETNLVHEVTPLVASRVVKSRDSSGSMKGIMFPTCLSPLPQTSPATIPESPVPNDGAPKHEDSAAASSKDLSIPTGSNKLQAELGGTPLMNSLMLAQRERSAKKHGLDWLFSTDTLKKNRLDQKESENELGNRLGTKISKAGQGEREEVVSGVAGKRESRSFLEVEFEGRTKRLCVTVSPTTAEEEEDSARSTPLVSSSEDETSELSSSMVTV